jgi:glycerol-3-phosphate dehydrogenase
MRDMIGSAGRLKQLGRHFGAGLYEAELEWLKEREFARTAEDVLWRRTKLGLDLTPAEARALAKQMGG